VKAMLWVKWVVSVVLILVMGLLLQVIFNTIELTGGPSYLYIVAALGMGIWTLFLLMLYRKSSDD
jgi:hypothetical protein